jgi:hypothetical protein
MDTQSLQPARPSADPWGANQLDPARPSTVEVVAWTDARVDALAIDPRSHYVETFWLGVLGPSATWLMRRLADRFEADPDGFHLDLDDTARCLGLGAAESRHSPLQRAVERCTHYSMARRSSEGVLAVRRWVPRVPRRQLLRLPTWLQERHRAWEDADPERDGAVRLRRRARLVALDLRDLGVEDAAIERHLLRRGVHPATAFEAARWAWSPENTGDRPCVTGTA